MRAFSILIFLFSALVSQAQNVLAQVERTFEGVEKVYIDGSFVDVYVKEGSAVSVKGIIEGSGDAGDYEFKLKQSERRVYLEVEKNVQVNWGSYKTTKSRIDLEIPSGVEIEIDNSSGDIFVSNLRANSSEISASSGDISLKNIIANLEVSTTSGDIEVDGLLGDSDLRSTSGDQLLSDTEGNITTEASSGDIRFDGFKGLLEVQATSGDLNFRDGIGGIKARTTSGEIDGNNIELTRNTYFDSTSGNIEMDFKNDLSSLSFDLRASSGDLQVGNQESERKLMIDRGGIIVRGVSSSGDQEYN